jgi:POT family proton-dependent oligopeptide transporter
MNEETAYPTLFGHPAGLYMLKGFLRYNDARQFSIMGAYASLVYMTPFIGGMLADRILGPRRAVIIGGVLMAIGELLIGVQSEMMFYLALALLVCGNGFFKPNISTMVGSLYGRENPKKDAGFTIFYMGINLGAALSPILCAEVAAAYGWQYGFGLAAIGMLIGVAVFAAPTILTQLLIASAAIGTAVLMGYPTDPLTQFFSRVFLIAALLTSAAISVIALSRGALPKTLGRPQDPGALARKVGGFLRTDMALGLGVLVCIPLFAVLVRSSTVTGLVLGLTGLCAFGYVIYDAFVRCGRIERQRIYVIVILMFFSTIFWTFFEQAPNSVNIFTDRNVNRVFGSHPVGPEEVGKTIQFRIPLKPKDPEIAKLPLLGQAQLGYKLNGEPFTMTRLEEFQEKANAPDATAAAQVLSWPVTKDDVGMGVGGKEIPTPEFQAVNPVYILLFGLVFSMLWVFLAKRNLDPSTPVKFALGVLLLGLGFGVLWYGTRNADSRGMVAATWLLLMYLLMTTGELCLSPVGLSMVTRLSPLRIVSTMMGAWFLATAFSEWLAGQLAQLTAVGHAASGKQIVPVPLETVHVYGSLFGKIAIAAFGVALLCFLLSPLLKRWEHPGEEAEPEPAPAQEGGFPVQPAE